jgi:undecaprenyl-diphosphatase
MHLLVLGAIQGITEFLPVSSSAHLVFLPQLLDWKGHDQGIEVVFSIGTLGVLCIYLCREIRDVMRGALDVVWGKATPERYLFWKVVVASLPVIAVGGIVELCFKLQLKSPLLLAVMSAFFALLLFWCDRIPRRFVLHRYQGSLVDALIVGCVQVCSLVPGVSRLGVSLSAMRFLGYDRLDAFRFSMLLSIPSVLGALTLKGLKAFSEGVVFSWGSIIGGNAVAFLCGTLVFYGMSRWLSKNGTFAPFVIYRLLLAALMIVM